MKILAIDPGAERMGWAVMSPGPELHGSGIVSFKRTENQPYQEFRMSVIHNHVAPQVESWLEDWHPTMIVNEIVPPVAGGAFGSNGVQAQLVVTVLTAVQTLAAYLGVPSFQVAATTVKKTVTGSGKATKVGVRNGVYKHLPHLAERGTKMVADESDAIAIGLTYLINGAKT